MKTKTARHVADYGLIRVSTTLVKVNIYGIIPIIMLLYQLSKMSILVLLAKPSFIINYDVLGPSLFASWDACRHSHLWISQELCLAEILFLRLPASPASSGQRDDAHTWSTRLFHLATKR